MKSKVWVAMAFAAVGLCSAPVRAEEDVRNSTSDERFKEGLAALEAGKFEQARVSFLQVLAVTPQKRTVLLNLAIAEHAGGHYVESLEHLKAYRANPNSDLNKNREIKQELYDELWNATGHLKVSADRGDDVTVNGEAKGKAPLADVVDVMPGRHRLVAGGRTVEVTVSAGETKDVNLASPVVARPAEQKKENFWTSQHVTGVALGGAAVVAAGLGIGFGVARESHVSDMKSVAGDLTACREQTSGACQKYLDAKEGKKSATTGEVVSFVAAGALAVGAVVLLVPWQKKEGARVSARLVPTGQGIVLDGAF